MEGDAMQNNGYTIVCASHREIRFARALGFEAIEHVGVRCHVGWPTAKSVMLGYGGLLGKAGTRKFEVGDLIDAYKVVELRGDKLVTLWEDQPLGLFGAKPGVILGSHRYIDTPAERHDLGEYADLVDNESHLLAAGGYFAGGLRLATDSDESPLRLLRYGLTKHGGINIPLVMLAFLLQPMASVKTARAVLRAERNFLGSLAGELLLAEAR